MRSDNNRWDLSNREKFPEIEEHLTAAIKLGGMSTGDKIVYGETDVTVHDDHTATVTIRSNGRMFVFLLKLYANGGWDILSND